MANSLEGLEEKFRGLNNDRLADALRDRLNELTPRSTKWTPEVISLLLQLSNKPVVKTRVGDLELSNLPEATPPLTWEDLEADDPLPKQDAIWKDTDFAAESSDDDQEYYSYSNETSSSDDYLGESDINDTSSSLHEQVLKRQVCVTRSMKPFL